MFKVKANTTSNLPAARKYGGTTLGQKSAVGLIAIFLSLGLLIPGVYAGCACSAVGNWDPSAFLNSGVPGVQSATKNTSTNTSTTSAVIGAQDAPQTVLRSDIFPNGQIIKPLQSVSSSDLVLDVSIDNSYSQSHIKGALHVSSKSFLNDDGTLKPVSELAKILGDAGVSHKDPAVIYSDNLGDATFFFWTMRYLGQEDVKVLDGSFEDWKAAKLPFDASQIAKPAVNYAPNVRLELLADYRNVTSGSAQLVDARPFIEFSKGRIPNSISMDSAKVLENGKIKNKDALRTSSAAWLRTSRSSSTPMITTELLCCGTPSSSWAMRPKSTPGRIGQPTSQPPRRAIQHQQERTLQIRDATKKYGNA